MMIAILVLVGLLSLQQLTWQLSANRVAKQWSDTLDGIEARALRAAQASEALVLRQGERHAQVMASLEGVSRRRQRKPQRERIDTERSEAPTLEHTDEPLELERHRVGQ